MPYLNDSISSSTTLSPQPEYSGVRQVQRR